MEKIKQRIAEEAAEIEERKRKIEDELKEVQVKATEQKLCFVVWFGLLKFCHAECFCRICPIIS